MKMQSQKLYLFIIMILILILIIILIIIAHFSGPFQRTLILWEETGAPEVNQHISKLPTDRSGLKQSQTGRLQC